LASQLQQKGTQVSRQQREALEAAVADAGESVALFGGRDQPSSVDALFVMGLALDQLGRWAEAAQAFDDAICSARAALAGSPKLGMFEVMPEGEEEDEEEEEEEEDEEGKGPLPSSSPLVRRSDSFGRGGKGPFVQHRFEVKTFYKPTFCNHCSKLLVGLRNQGYACLICQSTVHTKCRQLYSASCLQPEKHSFHVKTYYKPTFCKDCKQLLVGVIKQGMQCSVCKANIHEKCEANFSSSHSSCKAPAPGRRSLKSQSSKKEVSGPSLVDLYSSKGLALYHDSQYEEAIKVLTASAELCPPQEEETKYAAIANRGLCHFYLDQLDLAIANLSTAIEHGMRNEQLFSTRATAYQLQGKDGLAEADRKQGLLHNPRAIMKVFPYPLPLELVAHVLSFLSPQDKASCALTCHLWHDIIKAQQPFDHNLAPTSQVKVLQRDSLEELE